MLSRGYLIGQIVDDLETIAAQAKQRARLNLNDLTIYIEDFMKVILNMVYGYNLINLNAEKSNYPGLDLIDNHGGWGFQITIDKSGTKVKDTLVSIREHIDLQNRPEKIRVFIIGQKQTTYTLGDEVFNELGFKESMILDINDLCKSIVSLEFEKLKSLYDYISKECHRVRIELEVPDSDGGFPTSIDDHVEPLPSPKSTDGAHLYAHFTSEPEDLPLEEALIKEDFKELENKLLRLPRLTREVFKLLVSRRDDPVKFNKLRFSAPRLKRIYSGDDLDGDMELLLEAGLIRLEEPEDHGLPFFWEIRFPCNEGSFGDLFVEFAELKSIDLQIPLVNLDFSGF